MLKSYMARPGEVERRWYVVDAEGKTLGRLASEIAKVLRGKNKAQYTPHIDVGDFVVVVNAERISVTGRKAEQKVYRRHTGYPGGLREVSYEQMLARKPTEILRKAVYGMMPKTRLARQQFKKLKIYAGPEHPHTAQDPQPYEVR
jgi:large subunit ribosomal protein L13